ncbi:ABC transporter permease subunit [Cytobacillus kochii]|uniref:ABC transporter permease subunit n=1 Tax=Cytobacillus TaxID=2675230 RepID=UPI00278178DB|nr:MULTISPECIES: ABC transporter permease subunit [Cytobacillus]MDQ0183967.1 peptide/nickel transport system permease protein [Cytobacillus kochii]MEA1852846.1 ABC transporter permease subunit [Cytobacillus sp. OWB-43]MED1604280.1 ABC transporter permease subunit [Cytobacillus kochii]
MVRYIQQMIIVIFLILFLATLPSIVLVNPTNGTVSLNFAQFPSMVGNFFKELSTGSLGTYYVGMEQRSIASEIGDNFFTSFYIVFVGVLLSILLSLLFGIFLSRFYLTKIFRVMMNIISTIPDFIFIIFALLFAVNIYKWTGFRVVSFLPNGGALNIWFPMVLVAIAPSIYLFKLISERYFLIAGEDYIRTAVAKGLKVDRINFQHVYKNIEPFLVADLVKVLSLAIGNLFIVEYLLNVSGLTKFVFQSFGDPQPIAIGLFGMLFISLLVFVVIRLLLYLFKRGFIYE